MTTNIHKALLLVKTFEIQATQLRTWLVALEFVNVFVVNPRV